MPVNDRAAGVVCILREPMGVGERDIAAANTLQNFPGIVTVYACVLIIPPAIKALSHAMAAVSAAVATIRGCDFVLASHSTLHPLPHLRHHVSRPKPHADAHRVINPSAAA